MAARRADEYFKYMTEGEVDEMTNPWRSPYERNVWRAEDIDEARVTTVGSFHAVGNSFADITVHSTGQMTIGDFLSEVEAQPDPVFFIEGEEYAGEMTWAGIVEETSEAIDMLESHSERTSYLHITLDLYEGIIKYDYIENRDYDLALSVIGPISMAPGIQDFIELGNRYLAQEVVTEGTANTIYYKGNRFERLEINGLPF